jgi:phosphoribosylanthranilate isomerase
VIAVKICGITDPAGRAAAIAAGADWLGFVFFPPSPRAVTPGVAAALAEGVAAVGLFVRPTEQQVAAVLAAVPLTALQVYDTPARCAGLRARFGLPVWQALGVAAREDLPARAAGVDRLVIDARPPRGATRPGGNAVAFEWSILQGWQAPAPWLLAGGLTVDNVATAIRASGARAVDVSSGVEREPGRKDPALIRAFVAAARAGGSAPRTPRQGALPPAPPPGDSSPGPHSFRGWKEEGA